MRAHVRTRPPPHTQLKTGHGDAYLLLPALREREMWISVTLCLHLSLLYCSKAGFVSSQGCSVSFLVLCWGYWYEWLCLAFYVGTWDLI